MPHDPVPKCPRCRGTTVKLVSQKHRWTEKSHNQPASTLSVYGCSCGTGFTHQVKHELEKLAEKIA